MPRFNVTAHARQVLSPIERAIYEMPVSAGGPDHAIEVGEIVRETIANFDREQRDRATQRDASNSCQKRMMPLRFAPNPRPRPKPRHSRAAQHKKRRIRG